VSPLDHAVHWAPTAHAHRDSGTHVCLFRMHTLPCYDPQCPLLLCPSMSSTLCAGLPGCGRGWCVMGACQKPPEGIRPLPL
jgi:hypothetical protein